MNSNWSEFMSNYVKSARGLMLDFDLLKIKEQMETVPMPADVKIRQNVIEKRVSRRKTMAPKLKAIDVETPEIKQDEQEQEFIDKPSENIIVEKQEVELEAESIKIKNKK
jgi:hypothetical protein